MKYLFDIGANNGDQWFNTLRQDHKESVTKDECVAWFKLNGFKIDFFIGDEIDIIFSRI